MQHFNTNPTAAAVQNTFGGDVVVIKPFHEVIDPRKVGVLNDVVHGLMNIPAVSNGVMPYYEGSPTGRHDFDQFKAAEFMVDYDKQNDNHLKAVPDVDLSKVSRALGVVLHRKYIFDKKTHKIVGYSAKVIAATTGK